MAKFKPTEQIEHGDLMTVKQYWEMVDEGSLIDYDGYGHPSNGFLQDSQIKVRPSDPASLPYQASHVVWYNR